MIDKRIWAFIITVLAVSWIVQVIVFGGYLPARYLPLYMYAPAFVAFVFFWSRKNPVKTQVALFTRRTSLRAWTFALLYPLCWLGLISLIALATGLGQFNSGFVPLLLNWQFLLFFAGLVIAALPTMFGEEYGWRGYLLPTLADGRSKLLATVVVGLVWGLWHIPSYFLSYSRAGMGDPYLLTAAGVLAVAVGAFPYTYLFFMNGNLLPCVLMHAIYDLSASQIFFGSPAVAGLTAGTVGLLVIPWPTVLGLLIVTGGALAFVFARLIHE